MKDGEFEGTNLGVRLRNGGDVSFLDQMAGQIDKLKTSLTTQKGKVDAEIKKYQTEQKTAMDNNKKMFEDVKYLRFKFCRSYKKLYKDITLNSRNMDLNISPQKMFQEIIKRENKFIDEIIKIEGSEILLDLYNQGYFLAERIKTNTQEENYSAFLDNYSTLKELLKNEKRKIMNKCEELY